MQRGLQRRRTVHIERETQIREQGDAAAKGRLIYVRQEVLV